MDNRMVKKLTMKKLIKLGVFLFGVALIVVMTLFNIGVKQDFGIFDWLSQTMILIGIMVFGLLLGESVGRDRQTEKVGGLYQNALKGYNDFVAAIQDIVVFFSSFYEWYLPQDIEKKKVNYLVMANVKPKKAKKIVRHCTMGDLEDLKKGPIKKKTDDGEVIISKLEEHEIPPVRDVLMGKITVDAPGASYYLSAFGGSSLRGTLENGRRIDAQIKFNKGANRALKLMTSTFVSLAWGALTITEMSGGDDKAAAMMAWFNLISRITALLTSLASGWSSSVITVKLEAEKIEDKRGVLHLFKESYDKKLFVPKDEDAQDADEYERYLLAQSRDSAKADAEGIIKESEEAVGDGEESDGAGQREQGIPIV